jgi:serine/threonine-protein kinase
VIGQTLGHYRVESQLGAGGMGVVYRAHDLKLERTVAIKVVGERLSSDPKARDRLLREARTASALNHPHVCTVYEVGEADGQVFIVMEYVEGQPLSALLSEPRPNEMVARYGIQIADALAHAHERGIVHRDLKSGNVMVTPEGRAKVLDFGLAKRLPAEDLSEQATKSGDSLTEAGQLVGTLHYLAPEVLRGQPADARTDIWALGVVLYQLASGELPFKGRTHYEVTGAIQSESPAALPPRVPVALQAVIQRCLAKEPGQRYQRASEVRAALEAVQLGSGPLPRRPEPTRRWGSWAAGGLVILLCAAGAYRWLHPRDRGIQSIAVLPFANVGGNADNEYLSDGVTESVIGDLSHLPRLKMIAFGSVLRYKGRPVDAATVARELTVDALVVGRVTPRPDGLEVSAELIDTRDGSRIWGEQYDTKASALLSVQQEISRQVSDQLRSHLSEQEKSLVTRRHTESTEAYQLYLKGRYYWNKFTPESYAKSLEFYSKAIEKDPDYAPAYAGIAACHGAMTWEGQLPPKDGFPQVEAALTKALKLDNTLAMAHWAVAEELKFGRDWDWPAAEKEYQRAIALDPQDPIILRFHSQFLRALGRWDDAIAEIKRALQVDPLSVETNKSLGTTYYQARRYDEAIEQFKRTLEIEPNYGPVHDLLAEVYARKGMYKEAIAEQQQVFLLDGDKESAEGLGQDFKTLGFERVMRQKAQATLDGLKRESKDAYVSPIPFAITYAQLGDKDEAFAWLEKAHAERSPWLVFLNSDPEFDDLRSDARFTALVRRVGLSP